MVGGNGTNLGGGAGGAGGTITLITEDGDVTVGVNSFSAFTSGGQSKADGENGGAAGALVITAKDTTDDAAAANDIVFDGFLTMLGGLSPDGDGGKGGDITFTTDDGSITVGAGPGFSSDATGGAANGLDGEAGGDGGDLIMTAGDPTGGTGTGNIALDGSYTGQAGSSASGTGGTGGTLTLETEDGNITVGGDSSFTTDQDGGVGLAGGIGGAVDITAGDSDD